jgi:hypothetical protein
MLSWRSKIHLCKYCLKILCFSCVSHQGISSSVSCANPQLSDIICIISTVSLSSLQLLYNETEKSPIVQFLFSEQEKAICGMYLIPMVIPAIHRHIPLFKEIMHYPVQQVRASCVKMKICMVTGKLHQARSTKHTFLVLLRHSTMWYTVIHVLNLKSMDAEVRHIECLRCVIAAIPLAATQCAM